jgi:hypothetical protein
MRARVVRDDVREQHPVSLDRPGEAMTTVAVCSQKQARARSKSTSFRLINGAIEHSVQAIRRRPVLRRASGDDSCWRARLIDCLGARKLSRSGQVGRQVPSGGAPNDARRIPWLQIVAVRTQ